MNRLYAGNGYFRDNNSNIIILRGVNLAGSSKVPFAPDGTTHFNQIDSFHNHRDVSFVGRPFPEEEANEHFDRLKKWGFNFLRFLVTWEAIEHSGPGVYDEAYIDYIVRLVKLAEKKGFYLFIDPHQDVWSRFTGGDGAPGWTLESIGMDIKKLALSEHVILHHVQGESYKRMSWPYNYQMYPTATMFTLFFAGSVFASKTKVDGENIQFYLQNKYITAITHLAKRLSASKNVIGFDSLNEPSPGYIGKKNISLADWAGIGIHHVPTIFQEMVATEGVKVKAPYKFMLNKRGLIIGFGWFNKKNYSIWQKNYECIWRREGVWNYDPNGAPMLLRPDHFEKVNGRKAEFFRDFLKPFIKSFKTAIQKVNKQFFIFIESDPSKLELEWHEEEKRGYSSVVNATHWYDGFLLFSKRYTKKFGVDSISLKPVFGEKQLQFMYERSIGAIRDMSRMKMRNCPTVIGETGIPMDLNHRYAYKTSDHSMLENKMDLIFKAIEKNLVNVTLWNYTPDNTHDLGDRWNEEDLSIYSKDTQAEIGTDGGRAVRAFVRPYAFFTCGEPVYMHFDLKKAMFKYAFKRAGKENPSCKIFLPEIHYGRGFRVLVSAGSYSYNSEKSILTFHGEKGVEHFGITVIPG